MSHQRKKRSHLRTDRIIGALVVLLLAIGGIFLLVIAFSQSKSATPKTKPSTSLATSTAQKSVSTRKSGSASFLAVGDNLIHGMVYYSAANHAATEGKSGSYDFAPFYNNTKSEIEKVDIAFVNQETPFAGAAVGGLSSYPTFNGPTQILDGLKAAGFDWVNMATNHSFDRGEEGIQAELQQVSTSGLIATGANASQADQNRIRTIKKNGITYAFDSFTYGLNGFSLPEGKDYLVNVTSKALIKQQVEAMKKVSDVQIVNMHWGTEYSTTISDEQKQLAQYLADLGVDVIIAEHPHVIEPVQWITSSAGQKVLVVYSMGNFLSAQEDNINMLGLCVEWSVKVDKGQVSVADVKILPTVTMIYGPWNSTSGDFSVKFLKDYTDADAAQHTLTSLGVDMSRQYFLDQVKQIIGSPPDMQVVT